MPTSPPTASPSAEVATPLFLTAQLTSATLVRLLPTVTAQPSSVPTPMLPVTVAD